MSLSQDIQETLLQSTHITHYHQPNALSQSNQEWHVTSAPIINHSENCTIDIANPEYQQNDFLYDIARHSDTTAIPQKDKVMSTIHKSSRNIIAFRNIETNKLTLRKRAAYNDYDNSKFEEIDSRLEELHQAYGEPIPSLLELLDKSSGSLYDLE